jgi:hypothetical protein
VVSRAGGSQLASARRVGKAIALGLALMIAPSSLSRSAHGPAPKPVRIEILKQDCKLILYSGQKAVRTYRIGLGTNPTGPKTKVGDGRTPEGDYYVCGKNPRSRFYRSLALSYPNVKDAERGLRERRITRAQYDQIAEAIRKKGRPPWDTPYRGFDISGGPVSVAPPVKTSPGEFSAFSGNAENSTGGEIFIHGNGSKTDWTLGCIALDNGDMRQLYDLAPVGTRVTIRS